MHRYLMLRHLLFTKTTRDQSMSVAPMVRDLDKGWVWVWVFTRTKEKKRVRLCTPASDETKTLFPVYLPLRSLVWLISSQKNGGSKHFFFFLTTEESAVQSHYRFSLWDICFHIRRNTGSFFRSTTTKIPKTFLGWLLN